jgi:aminoglycoside phosphotransferase (APT) family kinase protein
MSVLPEPYLKIVRNELASHLKRGGDSDDRRELTFCHRLLTSLIAEREILPRLQREALEKLAAFLERLSAELQVLPGGAMLTAELIRHLRSRPDYEQAEPYLQQAIAILAASDRDTAKSLLRDIAAITFDLHQEFYDANREQDAAAETDTQTRETGLDATQQAALEHYLRRSFSDETDVEIDSLHLVVGGGSKLTLFVSLKNNRVLPTVLVLRKDSANYGGVVDSTVANEYSLIEAMYRAGVPGAQPFALERDAAVLGAPFMLVSKVEGHNIGDWIYVTEPSRDFAVDLASAMAKMHTVSPDALGNSVGGNETSLREQVVNDIAKCENIWRSLRQPSIGMEQALAWLKSHLDFCEGRRAIIHCDIGCHNMLGKDGRLTAILDWETARIGNPAADLALARPTVEQMMPWDEFLAEYERDGGIIPSQKERDFYELWRCMLQIHWLYIARSYVLAELSSSVIHAYGSQRLYHHLDRDLHKAVKNVYARY